MSEITLNVPQGIGDAFWIYQKFASYYDRIHFRPCVMGELSPAALKLQARVDGWLQLLPKTGRVEPISVTAWYFRELLTRSYRIGRIMAAGPGPHDYAVNRDLEEGIRLEAIDPEYPVAWDVPMATAETPLPFDSYVLLYVSGSYRHPRSWPIDRWVDMVMAVYGRGGWSYPLVVVGASYDEPIVSDLAQALRTAGYRASSYVDQPPAHVAHIIKHARYMIGFQSGLSIVADNFDVPQLMLYVPEPDAWLAPTAYPKRLLMGAWPKQRNLDSGVHAAATFRETPGDIARRLRLPDCGDV